MYRIRRSDCTSAIFIVLLSFSFTATALNIEPGVGVGMQYTNNAAFAENNEESDLIVITSVAAKLDVGSGPSYLKATTLLKHQNYTQDTFDDENYFSLNATAGWEMFKDRLDWTIQNFFTQRSINSLDPTTPDNTQDTNVFTFGANIYFPISGRQSVSLSPEYRKFTYETQDIDNQQNSLNVSWNYQLFRTMNVGLRGNVNKVDYDERFITDNTFRSAHLTLSGRRLSSSYSADLGATHVERESGESERGFTGNISWLFNVTGYSSLRAFISSDITDSNNGLLNSSTNLNDGDFLNEQISSEVFRNSIIRLTYQRNGASLQSNVWIELREQDYETALLDREVQAVGWQFSYPVTAAVSTGIGVNYNHTELTDVNREDDRYKVNGNINYRISRKLRARLDINYQNRDSTVDTEDYNEMSVFVGVSYGYGQVSRATRSGGGY